MVLAYPKRGIGARINGATLTPEMTSAWINDLMDKDMTLDKRSLRPKVNVDFPVGSTMALIDTGADVSVLSLRLFNTLKQPLQRPARNGLSMRLRSATGNNVKIIGRAYINIRIGGREVSQLFLVVDGINSQCILGADFLTRHGVILDSGSRTLAWPTEPNVVSGTDLCLPPRTERRLKVQVRGLERNSSGDKQWVFEPCVGYVLDSLLEVGPDHQSYVLVQNPTDFPLEVIRGEKLGTISTCEILSLEALKATVKPDLNLRPDTPNKKNGNVDPSLDSIPLPFKPAYRKLLNTYADIFSTNQYDVGLTKVMAQKIQLIDPNKIACTPPYRIPENLRPVAHDYIKQLAAAGIIQRSTSPFSSPLMLVRKGDASPDKELREQYRVVHDFRRLNANTVRDSYPMRNLYELLDDVARAKVWTVIDLSSGFWNQELDKVSRPYTAFGLPMAGHWEYTRCAQGLTNSPASFQRLLDHVTQGLAGVHVYIDDVIVCSMDHQEHLQRLQGVFSRFRQFNLKCKRSKLQLGAAEVNYLGYNVSREHGIRAGAAKIEVIRRWSAPTTVTEIKQFLGLGSFFRKTVPDFAQKASPLTRLTRKDAKWNPPDLPADARKAFEVLKEALCSRPCLAPVNFDQEFILTTDASLVGLGAVLSQVNPQGVEHPCAYASRVLTEPEKKWPPTHLEHLAMVWGCRHFRPYLAGKHFSLRTDHKPLCALNRIQGVVLERLQAELEEYRPFTVQYIKGDKMPADGLSRQSLDELENEITPPVGQVRIVPAVVSTDQLYDLQRQDKTIKALVCKLKFGQNPKDARLQSFVTQLEGKAMIRKGVVMIKSKAGLAQWVALAPTSIHASLLFHAHDSPLAGHRAYRPTLEKLQEHWFWTGMDLDVERHCKSCKICLAVNQPAHSRPSPMGKLPTATHFNNRVHMDLLGPLPLAGGCRYLMVMQDAHTKWIELAALTDKRAVEAARGLMDSWISRHGSPDQLVSDQGKEFVNSTIGDICSRMHISHQTTSAMHPQANGLVERSNRTILAYLRKYLEGSNDWVSLLAAMQFSYNVATHASSGHSPFQLVYGRRPNVPLVLRDPSTHSRYSEDETVQRLRAQAVMQREVIENEEAAWREQKRQFDKRSKSKVVKPGDVVYVNRPHTGNQFQKFQPLFMGPYEVLKITENSGVEIKRTDGKITLVHLDRIKLAPFTAQIFHEAPGPDCEVSTSEPPPANGTSLPTVDDGDEAQAPARGPRLRPRHPAAGPQGPAMEAGAEAPPVQELPEVPRRAVHFDPSVRRREYPRRNETEAEVEVPRGKMSRIASRVKEFARQLSPGSEGRSSRSRPDPGRLPVFFPTGRIERERQAEAETETDENSENESANE